MVEKLILKTHKMGWWHLIVGIAMVMLGIYMWANPGETLLGIALYLGLVFLIVGVGYVAASFYFDSGWYMLVGVIDVLVGLIFVGNIGLTALTLPVILALWWMAVGAVQVVSAYRLYKGAMPWMWTLMLGLAGIFFGYWVLLYPVIGTITIVAIMGAYMIIYGLLAIAEYIYFCKSCEYNQTEI